MVTLNSPSRVFMETCFCCHPAVTPPLPKGSEVTAAAEEGVTEEGGGDEEDRGLSRLPPITDLPANAEEGSDFLREEAEGVVVNPKGGRRLEEEDKGDLWL